MDFRGRSRPLVSPMGFSDKEEVPGSSPGSPTNRNPGFPSICAIVRFLAVCGSARSGWSMRPPWGHQLLPAGGKALLVSRRRPGRRGLRERRSLRQFRPGGNWPASAGTLRWAVGGPEERHRPPRRRPAASARWIEGRDATAWRSPSGPCGRDGIAVLKVRVERRALAGGRSCRADKPCTLSEAEARLSRGQIACTAA